jgi:hypothetical protein
MNYTLDQLLQSLTQSLTGLDATQTQLRPLSHPEKWSIQQIVEHLLLTYSASAAALEARIAKGTPTQAKPLPQQRVAQFVVTTLGLMPGRREAPAPVTPPSDSQPLSGADLLAEASQRLATLDQLINRAEGLFGHQRATNHIILGPLSAHQWRRFQLVHGTHHTKQILAIRNSYGL